MKSTSRRVQIVLFMAPFALAIASTTLILLLTGADPLAAYGNILIGAFESPRKMADVAAAFVPLLLCSAGMLVTFAAGIWNIGVEGQMVAGALMATWVIKAVPAPSFVILPLSILAGLAGGALWGLAVGLLRTYGRVNEIFAGLGLNFVATALTNYLIFGPWKQPGRATMSGTEPFPEQAWMPLLGNTRFSPITFALAIVAIGAVLIVLRNTYWGLKLKAIGHNARAAQRMGIDAMRHMLLSLAVCGALAGLAGSIQTTAVYRRLIPQVSGGYGYLSMLVVLLAGLRAQWVPLVALFFSMIQVGSPRLELRLQLDSSLGGILQASIVLFFLLMRGMRQRIEKGRR